MSVRKATQAPASSPSVVKKRKIKVVQEQMTTLPLMLPKTHSDNTILVQLDDRQLNMAGDAGAIGRLRVKDGRLELDLNGKRLKGQTFPSVTCMIVTIGKTEAKVTHVVDEICVVSGKEDMLNKMGGVVVGGEDVDRKQILKLKVTAVKNEKKIKTGLEGSTKTASNSASSSSDSTKKSKTPKKAVPKKKEPKVIELDGSSEDEDLASMAAFLDAPNSVKKKKKKKDDDDEDYEP